MMPPDHRSSDAAGAVVGGSRTPGTRGTWHASPPGPAAGERAAGAGGTSARGPDGVRPGPPPREAPASGPGAGGSARSQRRRRRPRIRSWSGGSGIAGPSTGGSSTAAPGGGGARPLDFSHYIHGPTNPIAGWHGRSPRRAPGWCAAEACFAVSRSDVGGAGAGASRRRTRSPPPCLPGSYHAGTLGPRAKDRAGTIAPGSSPRAAGGPL